MKLTKEQSQIVKRARDRIADPAHWCQGDFARTRDGIRCPETDPKADKFCAAGALRVEAFTLHNRDYCHSHAEVVLITGIISPDADFWHVNDWNGHKAVLELFDKALAS